MGAERDRLHHPDAAVRDAWRAWGPFVSEREWGTVREDYSSNGEAWSATTHDHARSLAYRWGEDGLAGVCDRRQAMCFGLALWNGEDPILKERLFGLGGPEGNHGEDVKECYWYVDATPTHSWLRWRYHYPQTAFPYDELCAENARRGYDETEYELIDTGVFEQGFWIIEVTYAKAGPDDVCVRIVATNRGPARAELHVLPTFWLRNTWSWVPGRERPSLRGHAHGDGHAIVLDHPRLGRWVATASSGADGDGEPLFCENETNLSRLYGVSGGPYPKDGINDHVIGRAPTVNPDRTGTKAAWWYRRTVEPGEQIELRVRFARRGDSPTSAPTPPADEEVDRRPIHVEDLPDLGADFEAVLGERAQDADEFYDELAPGLDATRALVMRQAFAGLLWSQQFFRYDVDRWLDGDPAQPLPARHRGDIRNGHWRHLDANDVIVMPDKWEYPWFASWDLAFHCVALAHIDPELAKQQLLLLLQVWYQHPNGQVPAYEWSFDDANPPVYAWAAMRVYDIDGSRDQDFLERVFGKLLLDFTWWVNRKDADGNNAFEGGFLGLDNIGPFNRSEPLDIDGRLEQSDGTGWMAMYCLNMLHIALVLASEHPAYEDLAVKFFEHFALIVDAMEETGFWSEDDGFYFDVIRLSSGELVPVKVRSMVGVVPMVALAVADASHMSSLHEFRARVAWFLTHRTSSTPIFGGTSEDDERRRMVSMVDPVRLQRILQCLLDEEQFLSPHGLRSLSRWHRDHPVSVDLGGLHAVVDYEPGESTSGLFGGNSNWRGPVWFPLNFLVVEALRRYHEFVGSSVRVELPTGSGRLVELDVVADELSDRLVSLFLPSPASGGRPVFGGDDRFRDDPGWQDLIWFFEYFHGDSGAGLGASHQTGWTSLVADLILNRHRAGG